ncbi:hypothetical protein BJP40_29645 [Streptomyces sp. CC53]|uniref:hypothetical protein n=1 Tax=unclassified Streptomyces TaxID=2593676 RepID=UPI0008DD46CE|nr:MULTISPECIES: hypothetical protein [unclassified Streptomyces]OII62049.1 hypothetical protein BJP40_29645 [Streptomyces sp. CC53]OII67267.1 hypothetical protein BJP39_07100 [Streptomyces sp. CC77]
MSTEPNPAPQPLSRPTAVTAAAAVAGLEALAFIAGGLYVLVSTLTGRPDGVAQSVAGGLTLIVLGLIPLLAARGLLLLRRWSRGPAIIMQIMALPVAWTLIQATGAAVPAGVVLGAAALVALALLLNPATGRALGITPPGGA